MKKHQTTTKWVALLLLALFATSLTQSAIATDFSKQPFSIIWITDTQYLTESNPAYYDRLCQWIVNNSADYNVKMVVHTGDMVNEEGNLTQWENANKSISMLLKNGVPYCWNAGNHDYNATCWIGNQFSTLKPAVMQKKPWWVSTESNGMNNAVHFNVSGWDCLIINIAYQANDTTLAWANNLLDANPQSHAIIATHAYLNKQNKYGTWGLGLKEKVLDTHANVFLTLSGHYYPTPGGRIRSNHRDELLFNQQDEYNKTGAASARILTFDIQKGIITVQTYSLITNQFLQDDNNNFTLTTTFRSDAIDENPAFSNVVALIVVGVVCVVCLLVFVKFRR